MIYFDIFVLSLFLNLNKTHAILYKALPGVGSAANDCKGYYSTKHQAHTIQPPA